MPPSQPKPILLNVERVMREVVELATYRVADALQVPYDAVRVQLARRENGMFLDFDIGKGEAHAQVRIPLCPDTEPPMAAPTAEDILKVTVTEVWRAATPLLQERLQGLWDAQTA